MKSIVSDAVVELEKRMDDAELSNFNSGIDAISSDVSKACMCLMKCGSDSGSCCGSSLVNAERCM
jgi:hypothetical protein